MAIIARQFARPRGLLGHMVGRGMAKRNGEFSRWVVGEISKQHLGDVSRIVEIGPGPGVGLAEALTKFSDAHVWGVDISPEMLSLSRKRNVVALQAGRLSLIQGDITSVAKIAPVDVLIANHVLYFWHQPEVALAQLRNCLRSGGLLALGYQLGQNMPPMAQKYFPRQGHRLYQSDEEVGNLLRGAGFAAVTQTLKGSPETPEGRLALVTT